MTAVQPIADYDHLTVVGHSAGAEISMYFAKLHPELVKKVVVLDNLRVPFVTSGKFKILSFRSNDPQFKPDPGVIPSEEQREHLKNQVLTARSVISKVEPLVFKPGQPPPVLAW